MLRGTRVLARCLPSGDLDVRNGRVEIRYRPGDGRAYHAAQRNLERVGGELFPDDHCAEARPVEKARASQGAPGGKRVDRSPSAVRQHRSEPDAHEVLVYADGACSGNPGPAGLGAVMRFDDERWELSEYLGHATNNIAELTAILRAARAVPDKRRPVRIHTDSKYGIGVLTRGWKAKANRELVAEVKEALAQLDDYELIHVPGHAGVPLNERADALARQALTSRQGGDWVRVNGSEPESPPPRG